MDYTDGGIDCHLWSKRACTYYSSKAQACLNFQLPRYLEIANCNLITVACQQGDAMVKELPSDVAMVKELPSDVGINLNELGDEIAQQGDSSLSVTSQTVIKVKSVHISSPILTVKNSFFY